MLEKYKTVYEDVSYSSFRSLIDSVYHELQKCASTVYTNPVKKHNNH